MISFRANIKLHHYYYSTLHDFTLSFISIKLYETTSANMSLFQLASIFSHRQEVLSSNLPTHVVLKKLFSKKKKKKETTTSLPNEFLQAYK